MPSGEEKPNPRKSPSRFETNRFPLSLRKVRPVLSRPTHTNQEMVHSLGASSPSHLLLSPWSIVIESWP